MGRVFAIANQKGGVGKTTTSINLAAYLAQKGRRVLLLDIDPQANATSGLGYDKRRLFLSVYDVLIGGEPVERAVILTKRPGLDLLPSSTPLAGAEVELVALPDREMRLKRALAAARDRYDYVLIDCPPSLGLLTVNALCAADGVIVPLQCEYLALEGLTQLVDTVRLVQERLNPALRLAGIVLTMYDSRTTLAAEVVEEVRKHFAALAFDTLVPRNVRLSEAPSYGQTILEYDPRCRGAEAYAALADEFAARMETPSTSSGQGKPRGQGGSHA